MEIELVRARPSDAENLWHLQTEAFMDLYEKYQDTETSPATESIDKIIMRLNQDFTYYYYIKLDGETIGGVRVVDYKNDEPKRISPLFIMKEHRNKGLAQKAFLEIERIHGKHNWSLSTILQEKGNCYLYEKLGYTKTGLIENLKEGMDLVFYEKK